MMHVEFMKTFLLADSTSRWLLDSFRPAEPKNVWFVLSRYDVVEFMKNFLLSDSSEQMAVRVISAS